MQVSMSEYKNMRLQTGGWLVSLFWTKKLTHIQARSINESIPSRISTPCSQNATRSSSISRSISAIYKRRTFCYHFVIILLANSMTQLNNLIPMLSWVPQISMLNFLWISSQK
uniref:Uncharacterized protein n=1 Tax=Picea sitchensis TaxID=3332 RepID=D5ACE9_PICSI|nr:unknown [Picea sitchensis]